MLRASSELESRAALIISTHLLRTHGCWYEHERIYLGDEEFSQETKVDSDSGFDVFIGTCTIDVNFRSSEAQHSYAIQWHDQPSGGDAGGEWVAPTPTNRKIYKWRICRAVSTVEGHMEGYEHA